MEANETRPCRKCEGTGISTHTGSRCVWCRGAKVWSAPDVARIIDTLTTGRGAKGARRFRAAFPSTIDRRTVDGSRAHYVWRLARFHGGADVTLPVMAEIGTAGDPFRPELHTIAETLARRVFGTDLAAAYRWAGALRHDVNVPDSEPVSAHTGGSVADGNKPGWEKPEI